MVVPRLGSYFRSDMPNLVFANPGAAESSGTPGGWKPVVQDGDEAPAEGVARSQPDKDRKQEDRDAILLKPRVRKKPKAKTPYAGTELGIGQDLQQVQKFGGDPAKYRQPYTKFSDDSTREYRYAPGDPGSAGSPTFTGAMAYPLATADQQQAYRGYDTYFGQLTWMSPDRFLYFAGSSKDFTPHDESLERLREKFRTGTPLDFLVLELNADSYMRAEGPREPIRVVGHEGRHRAVVAKEFGITSVPVLLYPLSYREPKWSPEFREALKREDFRPQVFGRLVFADDTLYQDVTSPFPAPQGGSDVIENTNLDPRNRPRITRTDDKSKRALVRMKHWTGLPEPPATQDIGNANVTYPLGGARVRAAGARGFVDDLPKYTQSGEAPYKGRMVATHGFRVPLLWAADDDAPLLYLDFTLVDAAGDGNLVLYPELHKFTYANTALAEKMFGDRLDTEVESYLMRRLTPKVIEAAVESLGAAKPKAGEAAAKPKDGAEKPEPDKAKPAPAPRQPRQEKIGKGGRPAYNVLTDPTLKALAPGITDVERLFTTITRWPADGRFYADPNKLDATALGLLDKEKTGDGTYFSWVYSSQADVDREQLERFEKNEMTVERNPILIIQKKPAWDAVQPQVFERWQETLGRTR